MGPEQRERWRRRLASRVPLLGGILRRRALRALAAEASPPAAQVLAEALVGCGDDGCRSLLLEALSRLADPASRDAVCGVWAATRHPALAGLVTAWGRVADAPAPVRVLTALRLGPALHLDVGCREVLDALVDACRDGDDALADAARAALAEV